MKLKIEPITIIIGLAIIGAIGFSIVTKDIAYHFTG